MVPSLKTNSSSLKNTPGPKNQISCSNHSFWKGKYNVPMFHHPYNPWDWYNLPTFTTGIFTYIWLNFKINVGKYTIHGCYGSCFRNAAILKNDQVYPVIFPDIWQGYFGPIWLGVLVGIIWTIWTIARKDTFVVPNWGHWSVVVMGSKLAVTLTTITKTMLKEGDRRHDEAVASQKLLPPYHQK